VAVVLLSPLLAVLTGFTWAYTLAVLGLFLLFWALTRLAGHQLGLRWGDRRSYIAGLAYPMAVMGPLMLIGFAFGAGERGMARWNWLALELGTVFAATALGALLTEEAFFRGWLWGVLKREGQRTTIVLVWTSAVFMSWHLPIAVMETEFALPAAIVPLYLANILFIGLNWGMMRLRSGSILVPSLSHGLWNALAYTFFGYGTRMGELGISSYAIIDPERGWLGLVLNIGVFALLWRWWGHRSARTSPV
jgi:membrane protease YdiL (CAAX protease family)